MDNKTFSGCFHGESKIEVGLSITPIRPYISCGNPDCMNVVHFNKQSWERFKKHIEGIERIAFNKKSKKEVKA